MKRYWFPSLLCILLLATSCAHRRGNSVASPNRSVSQEQAQAPAQQPAQPSQPQKIGTEVTIGQNDGRTPLSGSEIFKRYNTAVILIVTSNGQEQLQGSGFFISDQGLAVSNYHVFEGTTVGAEMIKLANSDRVYKVSNIYVRDKAHDFIIFRVDCGKTNYLNIAKEKPQIGDKVFAIGSPRGLENTFSSGEVSQWRSNDVMQTNVQIDHGSSGGALINEYGEVVGITSGTFAEGSQANLNYAWSIDVIKPYIK
jgi:serine protease Do